MTTMKRAVALALSLVMLMGASALAGDETALTGAALEFLELGFSGEYAAATALLDETLSEALGGEAGLAAVFAQIGAYGDPEYGTPITAAFGAYQVVTIPLSFGAERLNADVTLTEEGMIAGLYFLPPQDDAEVMAATALLDALAAGDAKTLEAAYTDEMAAAMESGGGTQLMIEQVLGLYGRITSYGAAAKISQQGYQVVVIPVQFEHAALNATLSFDGEGRLAGLMLQPQVAIEDPAIPDGITEGEAVIDAGSGYPLGGTVCGPATGEGLPAVLLVSGSGANGRDETVGANRVFTQVAYGLGERGIVTLRFDKRTHTYPETMAEAGYSVREEYIEDVLAALDVLRADPRVDPARVYILGHSQGGMLAPRFVEEGADVAGLILMAGTPRLFSDLMYDQELNGLETAAKQMTDEEAEALRAQYDAWYQEASALYAMTEEEALAHAPLYSGAFPAYYLYEMAQTDALALLARQTQPLLILQGDNDWQVYADTDFAAYQEALADRPDTRFVLYEGLSHIFMPSAATSIVEALQEYNAPGVIPEEVFADVAEFVGA